MMNDPVDEAVERALEEFDTKPATARIYEPNMDDAHLGAVEEADWRYACYRNQYRDW